jgi:hypothetical protein
MDCRVEWSPEAVEDVEAIAEYIGRDSTFYARSVVSGRPLGRHAIFVLLNQVGDPIG